MKTRIVAVILCVLVIWTACTIDDAPLQTAYLELPETPYNYKVGSNNHLPTLGRVLFYDRQLSVNNSVSCASCHKQELAFADNLAFSKGFDNKATHRNSMPIQNILSTFQRDSGIVIDPGFAPQFSALFWDGREHVLDQMVLRPIVNHVEMGIRDLDALNQKIQSIGYYDQLFTNAFGSNEVTTEKVGIALGSFLSSITSEETKFDKFIKQEVMLSDLELQGQNLFFTTYDCNQCHQLQNPHGYIFAGTFANIGLDTNPQDKGLGGVTNVGTDNGKFKIPSLRNVAQTAPYMHDGRFETLDDVLDHYSENIADDPNLDFRLRRSGRPIRMNIPEGDRKAIIAFLHTMTDTKMLSDPKYSNPFKSK